MNLLLPFCDVSWENKGENSEAAMTVCLDNGINRSTLTWGPALRVCLQRGFGFAVTLNLGEKVLPS